MWDLPDCALEALRIPTPPPDSFKTKTSRESVLPLLSGKIVAEERPEPGRIVSLVEWLFGKGFSLLQWLFAKVLARIARWMGLARKLFLWSTLGSVYLFLLIIPEGCSVIINTGSWVAYQLAYRILFIAASIYFLAMRLAAAARRVRTIAPVSGIFEY